MRVDIAAADTQITPGVAQLVTMTIANTESVIAGYSIRVLGADPGWIELETDSLALFPDETRTLTITINPPAGIPAGSRRIAIQVRETTPPFTSSVTDIDLTVPAVPKSELRLEPLAVTAGKRAGFSLLVENTGNTSMRGLLSGDDPESQVHFAFEPDRVALAPGQHSVIDMRVTAKRHIFGTPTVRALSVYMESIPEDTFFAERPRSAMSDQELEPLAAATFVQKAVLARGALSLIGLLFAATVFAVVITVALSRLVAQSTADRNLALQVAAAKNGGAATGTSGVTGRVTQLTSGAAVPGVAVSIFATSDTTTAIATTATDDKGGYSVTDLPAGKYLLAYRGAGFVQVFYPNAADTADATTITLAAGQVRGGLNVSLGGVPSTISGTVVGDDVSAATLFLETVPGTSGPADDRSTPLTDTITPPVAPPDNGGAVVQREPIGSDGSFSLTNVPSPSVYDLVVTKQGYATSTQRIDIGAGEARTGISIELIKGDGVISGKISSGTASLAGAAISAMTGQSSTSTVSLTGAGAGQFTLRSLSTPATYTITASKSGYASQTLTLSLAAGQKLTGVDITLSKSSGGLNGLVTLAPGNKPAGGVGVTVTDGQLTVQTVTQSSGNIGAWSVAGLPVPGTYTITFARSDLQSQTVSVGLDSTGQITPGSVGTTVSQNGLQVTMQSSTATVQGTITQPGGGNDCDSANDLGEASVSLNSGSTSYAVTSASVSPNCGKYRLDDIPPGTYTLTVAASSGTSPSSQVISVTAGQQLTRNVNLSRPASLSGTVTTTDDNGNSVPESGWSVFLYLESNYPNTITATTRTDANGKFSFPDVDAGRYVIAVGPTDDPSNATNTVQVTVQPSQARTGVKIVVPR